ncbi:MAG: ABC transporter permease [Acidobacteria bacterium]|nr:ABC transporter permease [Acidobacteriota bacterium]
MNRWGIFFRIVSRAFWYRPGRVSAALASLTVGATLASVFLSLYFELPRKMTEEFRSLGANLVLAPTGNAQTLPESVFRQVGARHHQSELSRLPWLYAVGKVGSKVGNDDVIFGGTDLAELAAMKPWWQIVGWQVAGRQVAGNTSRDNSPGNLEAFLNTEASRQAMSPENQDRWLLAGEKAASHFGLQPGETVQLDYGGRALQLPLLAIVSTGGSEDSQLFLPLPALQELTGQPERLSLIELQAQGSGEQVEAVRQGLAALLPQTEVRPLRQVVESEARVVMKVRWLMFGLTGIVLGIVILSVMTTVSGLVLDRQREIGVMKALGGSDGMISLLFVTETACYASLAAMLGYLAGFGLAQWAALRMFGSVLQWRWDVLPAVVAVTLGVALMATAFPIHMVRKVDPAVSLRGN